MKKKIQILGTGCTKCALLSETAENAAKALDLEYTVEKVTNLKDIATFGVMFTPALVVDGVVKIAGKVPSLEDTKKLIA
jgi:small redox-active disulfide protein 2